MSIYILDLFLNSGLFLNLLENVVARRFVPKQSPFKRAIHRKRASFNGGLLCRGDISQAVNPFNTEFLAIREQLYKLNEVLSFYSNPAIEFTKLFCYNIRTGTCLLLKSSIR